MMPFHVLVGRAAADAFLVGTLTGSSRAQDAPERTLPHPGDLASVETVINAIDNVISGSATAELDWDRFKSLFAAGARLILKGRNLETGRTAAIVLTPDEYVERAANALKQPGGFFENEIGRTTEVYRNIAHSFSPCESLRDGESEPFMRETNSFRLLNDGEKWLIVSVFWEAERPDNIIPGKYLFD